MNDDKTERDVRERSGYEFHHAENQEEIVITTETPDEEIWLNDGDPDSPFFHTPRSAANTEIREIPTSSDSWPAWNEEEVNLHMNLPESAPRPLVVQPAPSGAIRTISNPLTEPFLRRMPSPCIPSGISSRPDTFLSRLSRPISPPY